MSSLHAMSAAGVLAVLVTTIGAEQQPPPVPPAPPIPVPAILRNYKPVTTERLKSPDDGDWLVVRRTYDGWGYSPLDQITPANVTRLQPAWVLSTGVTNGHEAPPMVNNGVMFVATPGNQILAIDAKSGELLWRYRRPLAESEQRRLNSPKERARPAKILGSHCERRNVRREELREWHSLPRS